MPEGLTKMEQVRWKRTQRAQVQTKPDVPAATGPAATRPSAPVPVHPVPCPPTSVPEAVAKVPTPPAPSPAADDAVKHVIHVRGIGMDGWDGTPEGRGTYENEDALEKIFSVFGVFLQATIRHRIVDGENTSWALVEMETAEAVDAALAAKEVKAGSQPLFLNRFSKKQADSSTGAMKSVSLQALKGLSASEVKALRMGKNLIAPPGLSVLQTIAWQRRAAKRRRA